MIDFIKAMIGSSPIEIIAVVCGLLNVGLIVRRSIWNYPFGFVMVVLYAKIFYDYQLYSDALLQIYFFVIQIYGVYYWLKGRQPDGRITIAVLPKEELPFYMLTTVAGWVVLSRLMTHFTDATHPEWDSAIAALSVMAQFLMTRRHWQSWVLWITVDILAIGLFYIKGLHPTAALYAVFLVLASVGLYQWLQAARTQEKDHE